MTQTPPSTSPVETGALDVSARVDIPGGRALIGTGQPIITVDEEGPLKHQKIAPFAIDEAQVTNARFRRFVDATGYVTDAERLGNSFVFAGLLPKNAAPTRAVAHAPWWRMVDSACWHRPCGLESDVVPLDDHPVVHVTWNDARAFARWAGGRLPTEAQWEHAARGGLEDVRFPWGDQEPDDDSFFPCNIWQGSFPDQNLEVDGYFATAPAKSFAPNGYGLYNMVGNAWDYTAEPFRLRSLRKVTRRAAKDRKGFKLSKGGSFLCHVSYCYRYRIAARTGTTQDSSTSHQSFRLVYLS
ncbi:MAG: formylglycine-generating enzyme family protein [Pseudomonadota bacterium]